MLISAAATAWPGTPDHLLLVIGAGWLASALFDAAYTKGRHIAWPALSGSGIFALIGELACPCAGSPPTSLCRSATRSVPAPSRPDARRVGEGVDRTCEY